MLPVCIPSYKNREITKKLFSQLSTFDDVYLFVYDFDYKESGYDKLELPSNVKVIQINIDRDFKKYNVKRTDLSTKRCFIFDYMTSLGIDTYISIDDDCGDQHFIRENDKLEKVELKTFIDKMYEKILTLDKWCIVSPFVFLLIISSVTFDLITMASSFFFIGSLCFTASVNPVTSHLK